MQDWKTPLDEADEAIQQAKAALVMDLNEHIRAVETYGRTASSANENGDKDVLITALIDVIQHAASALDWLRPLPREAEESSEP